MARRTCAMTPGRSSGRPTPGSWRRWRCATCRNAAFRWSNPARPARSSRSCNGATMRSRGMYCLFTCRCSSMWRRASKWRWMSLLMKISSIWTWPVGAKTAARSRSSSTSAGISVMSLARWVLPTVLSVIWWMSRRRLSSIIITTIGMIWMTEKNCFGFPNGTDGVIFIS